MKGQEEGNRFGVLRKAIISYQRRNMFMVTSIFDHSILAPSMHDHFRGSPKNPIGIS